MLGVLFCWTWIILKELAILTKSFYWRYFEWKFIPKQQKMSLTELHFYHSSVSLSAFVVRVGKTFFFLVGNVVVDDIVLSYFFTDGLLNFTVLTKLCSLLRVTLLLGSSNFLFLEVSCFCLLPFLNSLLEKALGCTLVSPLRESRYVLPLQLSDELLWHTFIFLYLSSIFMKNLLKFVSIFRICSLSLSFFFWLLFGCPTAKFRSTLVMDYSIGTACHRWNTNTQSINLETDMLHTALVWLSMKNYSS